MNNLIDGRLIFELKHLADIHAALKTRITELEQRESTPEDLQLISALKRLDDALEDFNTLFNQLSGALHRARTKIERLHAKSVEKYKDVPLCKTISDFLRYYNLQSMEELTLEQTKVLHARMWNTFEILERTSKELLSVYKVNDESALSLIQRKIYDARMKAVVENQDHYP